MRGILTGFGVGTALALLILATPAPGWGENVPLHMVPNPVLDAVGGRFKNARIASADRDRDNRGFVYEVTIRHEGKSVDVTLTPEGVIVLIKREIAATELPEPIAKVLEDTYPKATYDVVEAVTTVQGRQETLVYYEVDLMTAQRGIVEVRVSVDGKILKGGAVGRGHTR